MNDSKLYIFLVAIALSSMLSAQSMQAKAKTGPPRVLRGINEAFSDEHRTGRPIVVVHGFGDHYQKIRHCILPIDKATDSKRPIYSAPYQESLSFFPFNSLETLSKRFGKFIQVLLDNQRINNETGFDIVGISLGGLVSRVYIQNSIQYQHPRVRNFVTIGSPHYGIDFRALTRTANAKKKLTKSASGKMKGVAWKVAVIMTKKVSPFVKSISWGNKKIAPSNSTLKDLDFISTLVFGQDRIVTPIETQRVKINGEFSCLVQSDHLAYTSGGLPSLSAFLNHALAETDLERSNRQSMNDSYMLLGNMDCSNADEDSQYPADEDSQYPTDEGSQYYAAEDSYHTGEDSYHTLEHYEYPTETDSLPTESDSLPTESDSEYHTDEDSDN